MSEHAYSVTPVVDQSGGPVLGAIMRYRAECSCGAPFSLRDRQVDAGLDGLDHVRTAQGRKTRSEEMADEKAAKAAGKPLSPLRRQ